MNEHQKHGSPAASEGPDEPEATPDATIPCARVHTPDPGATVELTRPPGGRPAEARSDQTILHDSHAPEQPAAPDATILSGRSHQPNPGAGATVDLVRPTPASTDFRTDQTMVHESKAPEGPDGPDLFAETLDRPGPLPPEPPQPGPTLGAVGTAGHPRPTVPGYEILGELGRGGMGVVYKARQKGLNRLVALKMVLAGAHAGEVQLARFRTEGETVAKLDHPNIVQIYEVGEYEGLPYFSLEFVQGGSLSESIDGKPRPPREAAALVEQLARAMAVAHQHGVIHRDLKSANVLLSPEGTPKITDFGLAKSLENDSELTKSGTLMGTPSYMSPEQARGEHHAIGPLSDLYSLGAILYELLTGRPPFLAPSMLETIYQVRHQEPVPPSRLQPKVPRDLETICLKCLQKEPAKRYGSCEDLAEDLRRFRSGEAIRARPVGRVERAWRWCKRNPRAAVLTVAIALLSCTAVTSLAIVGVRLSRERQAVAETRRTATERIDQAAAAAAEGDYRRAGDMIGWSDPLLDGSPDLGDVRSRRDTLRAQVAVYADFKQLLDDARFDCRFGSRPEKERGRQTCARLLGLFDQIEARTGPAADGLPPLNPEQLQLFKEDAFEAFLVAAIVERELAEGAGEPARQAAARQAIAWLDRAETILPDTRTLYVRRADCWGTLGNNDADRADIKRAEAIEPTSAVDRFWRAFADYLRGEEADRKGNQKAAQDYFRKSITGYAAFVQQRPDNFWGYFNWAFCLVRLNDLDDAAIGFTTCIRIRPDFPWPYNNRGVVHLRQRRYDLAVQDFDAALARNPNYAEAWYNRGTAYAKMGKTDEALRDLAKALELNPNYTDAYAQRAGVYGARKQFPEALGDYDRLIALSTDKAPVYLQRAELYRAMGRDEDALKDYDEAIKIAPKPETVFARGNLHYALHNYAKARDDYSQVIARVPGAALPYANRAVANWQHKDFDAALKDWEQVTRLDKKNAEPFRYIGAVRMGRGEYAEALDAIQKALERKPDYPEAVWVRAQIYLWQGKAQEALAELDPLVARLTPDTPETLNVRGDVYRALGGFDSAASDYRRLIESKPKDHNALVNAYVSLALVLEKQGKPEEAKACYEQLVAAEPKSATAHLRRAEFRRDHGQFDPALEDCDRAARLEPASALPELVRASVEAARGRHREAVERAEAALKKAPPDDGRVLYAAACVWSLVSGAVAEASGPDAVLAKVYADRAAGLLAAALDKGFHDLSFPEHNRMAGDPALAPVRSHPKVRELLAGRP